MFVTFFYRLRNAGIPVSPTSFLRLQRALTMGLINSVADFYTAGRSILVKSERYFDLYDQVFAHHFEGAELPEVDGIEATRSIRELGSGVQVIALTSYKDEELVQAALDGAPDLLEVRGEVYMTNTDLASLNEQRKARDEPLLANTRNAAAASSALTCADLILGGYDNPIPLDETIDASYEVGKTLPSELRCTARGGCATTPSALALHRQR